MQRRTFLKGSLAGSTVAVAVGAGLLTPGAVMAAWPKRAFETEDMQTAMNDLFGTAQTEPTDDISIKAPDIAENGAVVPVSITSGIAGIEEIAIIAEKNGTPLAANFKLADNAKGFVSTRIKMAKTSNVIAVVKAGGKAYSARKEVKVTIGGCGG
ncbi:thiosulfate oxidation carrier protein SoxY [Thiohalophilus thiocyanatoxydans]|uniref:Thiosulfate-binding protein SoxY n=1 Tax=Thiohalophilus thiocyanatoxydans TaxID=381308 RepID=A0A4R8IQY3_9GAMM|nr:thiosulfate oxidation carrier protein SoxY [Thiohalophilus thiocyanatoxydans]TDY01680.1 thiosulfate-binding protein SoxY [Thiohalophilus thiocyanatoxydans]